MLRSLMMMLAALVLSGPGRDRPNATDTQVSEYDSGRDQIDDSFAGARWALSRKRDHTKNGPVSEL